MNNLLTVQLKCPHCGASLMDETRLIDNEPAVRLDITLNGKKGQVWLSSYYGSYNSVTSMPVKEGEIAEFSCPHCQEKLAAPQNCSLCEAPLVTFNLSTGGNMSICSRKGCQKHSAEFDDLATALQRLYHSFPYASAQHTVPTPTTPTTENAIELLPTGSFLNTFCPHCRTNLIKNGMIKLEVALANQKNGTLELDPHLNVYGKNSNVDFDKSLPVEDIKCPACQQSLLSDKKCPRCSAPTAKFDVAAMSRMVEFFICSREGCHWHGVSDEDLKHIALQDSNEW